MKASLLWVGCRAVFNADEANIYFSMEGKYSYAESGLRIVATKGVPSSDWCMCCWLQIKPEIQSFLVLSFTNFLLNKLVESKDKLKVNWDTLKK
jgi:hypothetical protein